MLPGQAAEKHAHARSYGEGARLRAATNGGVQPRGRLSPRTPHRAPHTPEHAGRLSPIVVLSPSKQPAPSTQHDKRARERLRPSQRWPMECELESIGMAQRNPAHRKKCMGSDSCRHQQTSRGVVVGTSPDRSQACLRVEFPRAIPMDSRPHFVAAREATPHGARAIRERDGARWRAVGSPQQLRPLERGEVLQAPGCACASILFHCFHDRDASSPPPPRPPFLCFFVSCEQTTRQECCCGNLPVAIPARHPSVRRTALL